jgi:hypothetical protein
MSLSSLAQPGNTFVVSGTSPRPSAFASTNSTIPGTTVLPYRDVAACNTTRNVDALLSRYEVERDTVVNLLKYEPSLLETSLYGPNSPISVDSQCLCQLGLNDAKGAVERLNRAEEGISRMNRRQYRCAQCTNLGRLTDIDSKTVGSPFHLEHGSSFGKKLVISSEQVRAQTINYDYKPARRLQELLQRDNEILSCEPNLIQLRGTKYLGSSTFTNRYLVTWYVDSLLSQIGSKGLRRILSAFICGDRGFYLEEAVGVGSIYDLISYDQYLTQEYTSAEITKSNTVVQTIVTQENQSLNEPRGINSRNSGFRSDSLMYVGPAKRRPIIIGFGTDNSMGAKNDVGSNDESLLGISEVEVKTVKEEPSDPVGPKYLKPELTKSILLQLVSHLHYLRDYGFSLGGAGLDNLLFDVDPTSYRYDGVSIMSQVTLKFSDLGYASITVLPPDLNVNTTRLYNYSETEELRIETNPYRPTVTTARVSCSLDNNRLACAVEQSLGNNTATSYRVYQLNSNTDLLFTHLQHLGIPLYQSSFDLYVLWSLLMCIPEFYESVMRENSLRRTWEELWLPEEYEDLREEIESYAKPKRRRDGSGCGKCVTRNEMIGILRRFRLRCDATEAAWKMLRDSV